MFGEAMFELGGVGDREELLERGRKLVGAQGFLGRLDDLGSILRSGRAAEETERDCHHARESDFHLGTASEIRVRLSSYPNGPKVLSERTPARPRFASRRVMESDRWGCSTTRQFGRLSAPCAVPFV